MRRQHPSSGRSLRASRGSVSDLATVLVTHDAIRDVTSPARRVVRKAVSGTMTERSCVSLKSRREAAAEWLEIGSGSRAAGSLLAGGPAWPDAMDW